MTRKRLDIQGLRAVAVLTVVANHLWDWPRGGFVGVDVFFVISGFLITGLLVREREKTGRINFLQFYARRIRRILPAALVVLAVTVFAMALLYSAARGKDTLVDGIWASSFAANWHFAIIGTDYFHNASVSPVQHYWSLSVEEQFYVFWPMIVLATMRLTGGRARRAEVLGAVMGVVAVASFAYSMWHTSTSPTWAYFSTFDRAWELALGAVAAVLVGHLARIPRRAAALLGWVGFAGIVVSVFLIHDTMRFPAPWAALPVLSAVAVIAAGVGGEQRTLLPLVNPVATYVGDISYSMYLWHFPVLIVLLAVFPDRGGAYALVAVALIALTSVTSYHLIEQPVLRSSWLLRDDTRRPVGLRSRAVRWWPALLAGVVAVLLLVSTRDSEIPAGPVAAPLAQGDGQHSTLVVLQQARVAAALDATEFPSFDLDRLTFAQWLADVTADGCADVVETAVDDCVFGPASAGKHLTVMGDSFAMTWMPGIRTALEHSGVSIQQLTLSQCPAWDVPVHKGAGEDYPECDTWRSWALSEIRRSKPDVVLLASAYPMIANLASGATGQAADQEAAAGLATTIKAIERAGSKVAVLGSPPSVGNLQQCVTRFGKPLDCATTIDALWTGVTDMEGSIASETGAAYIPVESWFCDGSGHCPGFVGATPVTVDGAHLSIAYSRELAPLIAESLRPLISNR